MSIDPPAPRDLTTETLVERIKEHNCSVGRYPTRDSGQVTLGEVTTWAQIDLALYRGKGDQSGGSSLAKFVASLTATPEAPAV